MNYRKRNIRRIVEQTLFETGIPPTAAVNAAANAIKARERDEYLNMPFNLPAAPNEADIQRLSPSERRRYEDRELRNQAKQYIDILNKMNPPTWMSPERGKEETARMAAHVNDPNSVYGRHPSLMLTGAGFYPNEKTGILDYPGEAITPKIQQELDMRRDHRAFQLELQRNNELRRRGIEPPPRQHRHPDADIEAMMPKENRLEDRG